MRILALDIGTGTQDILLFDSSKAIENCFKLVMPAPTVIAADRIREATRQGRPLALTGVNMGGGPVTEAMAAHVAAGLAVHATGEAAVTFNDDLDEVRAMGVTLATEDEVLRVPGALAVELRDLDIGRVRDALAAFNVDEEWDALAVAVFDHGDAPPGYSDRKFRFDYLRQQAARGERDVRSLSYKGHEAPESMTRMAAVVRTAGPDTPILVTDTAVAGVIGALEDRRVAEQRCKVVANLGNEHTIAFHLHSNTVQGLFEHHTGLLTRDTLEDYLSRLVLGGLEDQEVWLSQGHGAITLETCPAMPFLAVTGPRRGLMESSTLAPYFATPHGDMMLAGCFGLARAWAERHPPWREEILRALRSGDAEAR
jgi:uncharacterized protein (DUF1786 family)